MHKGIERAGGRSGDAAGDLHLNEGAFEHLPVYHGLSTRPFFAGGALHAIPTYSPDDLASPRVITDPFPAYHALRSLSPVRYMRVPAGIAPGVDRPIHSWALLRHADVYAALRDAGTFSSDFIRAFPLLPRLTLLHDDPPRHTRLRRLVKGHFRPSASPISSLRSRRPPTRSSTPWGAVQPSSCRVYDPAAHASDCRAARHCQGGVCDLSQMGRSASRVRCSGSCAWRRARSRSEGRRSFTAKQTARQILEFARERLGLEQHRALALWLDGAVFEEIARDLALDGADGAGKLVRAAVAILRRAFGGQADD